MLGIHYLLSDLDGVIRHFPLERDQAIERSCSLPSGTLRGAAFEKNLLTLAITGHISDELWRFEIVNSLSKLYPSHLVTQAVEDWSRFPGQIDYRYLECLKKRFPLLPMAILTNATSRLNQDLVELGITNYFFKIFNSSEIGVCKPDKNVFLHVVEVLECQPAEIFFIDDSLSNVNVARDLGMVAYHYRSFEEFQKWIEVMS